VQRRRWFKRLGGLPRQRVVGMIKIKSRRFGGGGGFKVSGKFGSLPFSQRDHICAVSTAGIEFLIVCQQFATDVLAELQRGDGFLSQRRGQVGYAQCLQITADQG